MSTHTQNMLDGLIQQFKGLPNIENVINALGAQLDDIDEFFCQILAKIPLGPNTSGAQLDAFGAGLQIPRSGLSDSDYLSVLQARIVQMQSNGTIEDLIGIMISLGGAQTVRITESQPARIQVIGEELTNAAIPLNILKSIILQSKLAGVALTLMDAVNPIFAYGNPTGYPSGSNFAGYGLGQYPKVL